MEWRKGGIPRSYPYIRISQGFQSQQRFKDFQRQTRSREFLSEAASAALALVAKNCFFDILTMFSCNKGFVFLQEMFCFFVTRAIFYMEQI